MSSGNGHEPSGIPVAKALMPSPISLHRRLASDLSSAERSHLLDSIVAQLEQVTRAHNAMDREMARVLAEHLRVLSEHCAMLDAHAGVVNRMTLWARLRWLLVGR